jgi:hypothetical protein
MVPFLNFDDRASRSGRAAAEARRFVRHDAVAWGYARGRPARGVDIIQNCEVTGIDIAMAARWASRPRAARSGEEDRLAVAGNSSSRVAAMAGMRLPIESHVLQAFVSEG